jgi:putative membrane protein
MTFLTSRISLLSFTVFALLLGAMGIAGIHLSMETMFAVSILMFATCSLSAMHLHGVRTAFKMIPLAVGIGFFAEYTGEHYGWFFGEYTFTDALGPRLAGVPVVIPLMWFNLTYMCSVLGNVVLHRSPLAPPGLGNALVSALFCATLVTAYDLGADPYMVYVAKAWIMAKTDGAWFGETALAFAGWTVISFAIACMFLLLQRSRREARPAPFEKKHALIPMLVYMNLMAFLVLYGHPLETRTISAYAMGIPLMAALFAYRSWSWNPAGAEA